MYKYNQMVDRYKNGKIYKLVSDVTDEVYIGSCCVPLAKRLYRHKYRYAYENLGKGFAGSSKELFKLGGNITIVLIEEFPCSNKMELERRERFWIENNKCVNYRIPTRSQKEYRGANKDTIAEKGKEYRHVNGGKIAEKSKEYREANKDAIAEKKKEYRESHRKELSEKERERYKQKREQILKANKEQVICEICGITCSKQHLKRHQKTKKCQVHKNDFSQQRFQSYLPAHNNGRKSDLHEV